MAIEGQQSRRRDEEEKAQAAGTRKRRAILEALSATLRRVLEEVEDQLMAESAVGAHPLEDNLTVAQIKLRETTYVLTRVKERSHLELSQRQHEVALLLAEGLSMKEVARRLGMSLRTVDSHRERVYTKLCVHSRVALARRVGLLN